MKTIYQTILFFLLLTLMACGAEPVQPEPTAASVVADPTAAPAQETAPEEPAATATSLPSAEATAAAETRLQARATVSADVAEAAPPTATPAIVVDDVPEKILTAVFEDLTVQTGLARAEFNIIQAVPITWSDGSLGCPEPGVMYTTALVDGYHIIVQQGDTIYDYRTDQGSIVTLCPNPLNVVPPAQGTPSS